MGRYLDRLRAEYDEILEGIETVTNRAADENRELTDDENQQIERDNTRAQQLQSSIENHAAMEEQRGRVQAALGRIPAGTGQVQRDRVGGSPVVDPEKQLRAMYPSAGHFIVDAGRALRGDKQALDRIDRSFELLERDTAHQITELNPGLLPIEFLGPVINDIDASRPFINSITRRPLPSGSFKRPIITQQVGVGIQAKEKDLTTSQALKVDDLDVDAVTFAGHLNLSRQNVKWSTPSLMQLVVDSFGDEYAIETDDWAIAQFITSLSEASTIEVADTTGQAFVSALFQASGAAIASRRTLPDTLWAAPDVWGVLGGLFTTDGRPLFPSLSPTSTSGNILGLRVVLDAFPAGTAVLGRSRAVEWYEDLDGLIQVAEPDVLGQLVGYAGFGAFLNTLPATFSVLELPAASGGTGDSGGSGGTGGTSSTSSGGSSTSSTSASSK